MGDLVDVDYDRIRLWTFARIAVDPPDDRSYEDWMGIAGATAP
jgi:hypothetical protein